MIEDCVTPNSGILKGDRCSTNVESVSTPIVASNSEVKFFYSYLFLIKN